MPEREDYNYQLFYLCPGQSQLQFFLFIGKGSPTMSVSTQGEGSTPREEGTGATSPGTSGNCKHVPSYGRCRPLRVLGVCGKNDKNTDH